MTAYTYTASPYFITTLTFDHVETYSFQRGAAFEKERKEMQDEFTKLKVRKDKRNNLTASEEERYLELNSLVGFTQYLLNDKGQFHPSAQKTNTFQSNNPNIDRIKSILLTEVVDIPQWMCAPVYRDAIVFYDKDNKIMTTLNICFSCQNMETVMFKHINGDFKTYDLLKHFFFEIGHEVEAL
jgi:hypothetical protein